MVQLDLIQALLPTVTSVWLVLGKPATLLDLISRIIGVWLVLAGVACAGVWLALPIITVPLLAILPFSGRRSQRPATGGERLGRQPESRSGSVASSRPRSS